MRCILDYGSEEMKQKYLSPMARGERGVGFAITEPGTGAGMDIKTEATRDGDN